MCPLSYISTQGCTSVATASLQGPFWLCLQVGPIVPGLLPPLVTKLAESESSPLVVNLLLVLAQLALINTNQLVDCLAAQPAPGMRHCT